MSRFGDFLQNVAHDIPGNRWASTSRLGDILTGGIARAANRNEWHLPGFGSDQTSIDDLAAVGTGNSSLYRSIARGAGAGFGGYGLASLFGGGSAASQVGEGFPLAEEAGGSGAEGQLSGPTGSESSTLSDYLRRYGRQGMNLLSRMGNSGGNTAGVAASADNSMIAPIPIQDLFAEPHSGEISPALMALLLSQHSSHADTGGLA